jgi:hypothetical protein
MVAPTANWRGSNRLTFFGLDEGDALHTDYTEQVDRRPPTTACGMVSTSQPLANEAQQNGHATGGHQNRH